MPFLTLPNSIFLRSRRTALVIAAGFCLLPSGCLYTPTVSERPASWAQPVDAEELANFHCVSPDLYRSARPNTEAYAEAHELGIRTVVNLRPGSRAAKSAGGTNPETINIPVHTGSPSYDQARRFFAIIDDPAKRPVLLHCYHGADRTGAFTALYRINRQGWSAEDAISEMTGGGFKFHSMWLSLADWVREAPEF